MFVPAKSMPGACTRNGSSVGGASCNKAAKTEQMNTVKMENFILTEHDEMLREQMKN
jgi:hypothetical protein